MASDSDEKEVQILSTMQVLYSTNREDVRRKLLDELIILLFRPAYDPTRFIDAGGITLLIRATGDRSEVIRHHAVHGLVRLMELGYAGRVMDAGAVSALQRLGEDPYRPVRETAKKAIGLLDIHRREGPSR
jgi:hypothetical protein